MQRSGSLLLAPCCEVLTASPCLEGRTAAAMIVRLGRLTPGYFRLLQRQASGKVMTQPSGGLINPVAVTMAAAGLCVSLYSTVQMADRSAV
ncbi:putative transmembrane protein ZNF593OS [Nerophis ophidion]|uniref:putative transmembrane protein ZNF593OS n=1 Tax=Nerophis ophidion TaxID=159077 RepID=UPI002ADFF016|nr:putative transmembrane protein ZNF593OS [Nerophis ophidion]